MRAFLVFLVLVVASLGVAVVRDPPMREAPAPLQIRKPEPGAPEAPPGEAPLVLEAAGVVFELPEGFRALPGSLVQERGYSAVRARGHGVLASARFYPRDAGVLREAYKELARRDPTDEEVEVLLGGHTLLTRSRKDRPGGTMLVFDLQPEARGQRETLVVAVPDGSDAVATLSLRYEFSGPTARFLLRALERTRFS